MFLISQILSQNLYVIHLEIIELGGYIRSVLDILKVFIEWAADPNMQEDSIRICTSRTKLFSLPNLLTK